MNLKKIEVPSLEYQIANFYFIREYCYGSMFRYNKDGEFNIPYGGASYNKKNLNNKIELMFNREIARTIKNTDIYNQDFDPNTILIEVGGQYNYIEEVNNTLKIFADILYDYLSEET